MANFFDQFDSAPEAAQPAGNYFDQFDAPQRPFDPNAPATHITVRPQDANLPTSQDQPGLQDTLGDVAKSAGIGLVKGGLGLAGMAGDVANLGTQGIDYLAGTHTNQIGKALGDYGGSQALQGYLEKATGPLYEPKTGYGRAAQTVTEFAPAMIGGAGSMAAKLATRMALPGGAAAAAGALTNDNPYAKIVAGVAGAAVPGGVFRAITPNAMNAERAAAVNTLASHGVTPPASMVTGSKLGKAMESELGGGKYSDAVAKMNEQYTTAALRKANIQGETRALPEVINAQEDKLGNVFNTVAARNPEIPLDGTFGMHSQKVAEDFKNLTGQPSPLIEGLIGRINGAKPAAPELPAAGSTITAAQFRNLSKAPSASKAISGETYQAIQSDIQRYGRAAVDPVLKHALYDLKAALDSAIERGLKNPADIKAWKEARHDWANLLVIKNAVSGSAETAANGLITPAKLTAAIEKQKRGSYVRGAGDFSGLARAGNQIMKPLADSGTASRVSAHALPALAGAVLGGGFGVIPGALMGMAAPWAMQVRALMSKPVQAYLKNQTAKRPVAQSIHSARPKTSASNY
jgi:hypothetical protein